MSARDVANQFCRSIEAMDFPGAFGMLAEDGQYVVIGTTELSRTYQGRADLFENLIPALSTFVEPPVLRFQEPIVDGQRVVMVAAGAGVGPKGPYNQPYYAFVARVEGEGFSEIIEFMDTQMLDSAVFGR